MNPGLIFHNFLYTFEAFNISNNDITKNDDAPITCNVQFISPPSDIEAVDKLKARHDRIDRNPKCFNPFAGSPVNSKLLIFKKFLIKNLVTSNFGSKWL